MTKTDDNTKLNKKCCDQCSCENCDEKECSCEDCQCCDGKCCDNCKCALVAEDGSAVSDPGQTGTDGRLEELEEKVKSLENQLKRALADYQNLEKRVAEGRSELSSWATVELLRKILPVLDHLDRALSGATDDDKKSGWFKGVQMAVSEFKGILKSEGLEEVEGDGEFNPSLHEAVDMKDGDDNKVLEVIEKGYKINGKVLRPSKVIVGKSSFAKASEDEKGEK